MPSTVPAMRGNFGSHEYYLTTMHVGELVKSITIPKDIPGWETLSIEERFQRDIKLNRVKKDIAPYFANDPERFSSALILAVQNHEGMQFESIGKLGANRHLPQLYVSAAENIGFLTFAGGEVFVPLDGQHRAKAFEYAIRGTDDANRPIAGVSGNTGLANEDVAVLLVRFETEPSRRIFNKVNRYAKPTTKGDNLIIDDDDVIAVITRGMFSGEDGKKPLIPSRLVRYESNTLNVRAPEFTTLATLYDANVEIAKLEPSLPGKTKVQDAPPEVWTVYKRAIHEVWSLLLDKDDGIELFGEALSDTDETGDDRRREVRRDTLLGKPIGQIALVRAFLQIRERAYGVSPEDICDRLNRVDWRLDDPQWVGVLMNPNGRVMSGKTTVNMAADFIAHLCGAALTEDERIRLREHIWGAGTEQELPAPVA